MKKFLLPVFLILSLFSFAQEKVILSGTITDASTGEDLIGATVYLEQTKFGTTSNSYGIYTLSLKPGTYSATFSFLGYESQSLNISVDKNMKRNIRLTPKAEQLDEVVVSSRARNQNIV
ncbi:MAG TPA: carboxypeptidase-like regulatory domain-containing protein, partial [Prolixibacteraceae bacterium]|nr:carboxypeptidase-like regulatory domain-containing protein [Prolixibacteraceae bacterium]